MWKKPLALKIVIWICVVFMVVSLIWVYVVYMFSPVQENIDWNLDQGITDANTGIILPEIDAEDPENTDAPILITEDGEIDELNQTMEVQLENGETELVRLGDLGDAIQIN